MLLITIPVPLLKFKLVIICQ